MPKRTDSYRESLLQDLLDPFEAAAYLNAASEEDDSQAVLVALRDVAEAHQLAQVANAAGITQEAIYRILSSSGNFRLDTLNRIAKVLGLRIKFEPAKAAGGQHMAASGRTARANAFPPAPALQGFTGQQNAARKGPKQAFSNVSLIGARPFAGQILQQRALAPSGS